MKDKKKMTSGQVLYNGVITENPTFRLVLGTCPTLAITTTVTNGVGMGLAATFVLIFSNLVISALRNFIPDKVRIPAYVVVIASFVTIVQMVMKAYLPDLDKSLGLFIPLIVVNCIILARAESFASKNNVWHSILDGVGIGIGFTLALCIMGAIREILGAGTFLSFNLFPEGFEPMAFFARPAGGFITFGTLLALFNVIMNKLDAKKKGKKA